MAPKRKVALMAAKVQNPPANKAVLGVTTSTATTVTNDGEGDGVTAAKGGGKKARVSVSGGPGGKGGLKTMTKSASKRAGIQFPIPRVLRKLRKGRYASRISKTAAVYLSAVMEYMTAEVLDMSGSTAREHKRVRITPRHVCLAIRTDEELDKFLSKVDISAGGVIPKVHNFLFPKHPTAD